MRASVLILLLSKVLLAEASQVSADAPAPAPGGGAPVDPYPGDPSGPPQSPSARSPRAAPSPPPQSPPATADTHAASSPAADAATDAAPPAAQPAPPPAPPPLPKNALGLSILPPDAIPATCKPLAKDAEAPALNRALSARISLASCLAEAQLKPIALCDCEQSVRDVEGATKLSVLLLDEVYAAGDASMKILARQATGDLLAGLVQRIVTTVPPARDASPAAIQLRQTRLDMLQPLIDPWQARAQACFTDVDRIARANPQLANNPAVAAAVRSSRAKLLAPGVARR